MSTKTWFKCLNCKIDFFVWTCRLNAKRKRTGKFCCKECRKQFDDKRLSSKCKECGETFRQRGSMAKTGRTIYCSMACWHKVEKKLGESRTKHMMTKLCIEKRRESMVAANRIGVKSKAFKTGTHIGKNGYVYISSKAFGVKVPMLYHRYIVEKDLCRKLSSDEIIHHADGNKLNNDLSNLVVTNQADHTKWHHIGKKIGKKTQK